MIFNLKKKEGDTDVVCVNYVWTMGVRKRCENMVDVVRLRQREE